MKFLLTFSFLVPTFVSFGQRVESNQVIPSKYSIEFGAVSYSDVICTDYSFSVKVQTLKGSLTLSLNKSENNVYIKEDNVVKEFVKNNDVYNSKGSIELAHKDLLLEVFEDFKSNCKALVFTVPDQTGVSGKKSAGSAHWSKRRCAREINDALGCGGTSHVIMDCVCAVGDYACVCYGECN
jgi:hypothetical protein